MLLPHSRVHTRTLRDLQHGFAHALLSGVTGRDTPAIRADGVSPAQRVGFYRANVFGNYLDALRATYRAVDALIGSSAFAHLADRFARLVPSRSGDLNCYGDAFPEFLRTEPSGREHPYLADVARLEWLLEKVFSAAEHAPLSLDRLSQVPAEQYGSIGFVLHPACRLLRSSYPVREIWQAAVASSVRDREWLLGQSGQTLLLRRQSFEVIVDVLDEGEYAMLAALGMDGTLAQAYAEAIAVEPQFDAAQFLQRQVGNGTLVDFICV